MEKIRAVPVLQNRRGATIPIVAVCLVMLIGCAAIAIDVGMLLDSRAEAQRAADAAALAGASALLDHRFDSESVQEAAAIARAHEYASLNTVRGQPVESAEVGVEFLDDNKRIAATVTRASIPPLFASIFGVNSLQVAATAHAMYYQGGSSNCLKPLSVPDRNPYNNPIDENDIGGEILVWQKSAGSGGSEALYPLIKHLLQEAGENNVRQAVESQKCNLAVVNVGEILELQSATSSMAGQIDKGLETLRDRDTSIDWNPEEYGWDYNGFNTPDWRNSSRIINLTLYEYPNTYGNTSFKVTGFITVFLNRYETVQQGNDLLQYGILLPHRPIGGPCTPPNCSATSWSLRLVR